MNVALFATWFLPAFSQDDVYYSPSNDRGRNSRNNQNFERQFNNDNRSTDPYNYSEASRSTSSQTSSSQFNDGYEMDDNDFYYTSRLRRFYTPTFGVNYWDPWYTDAFFYTRDPWMWGNSIYVNIIPSWHWWRPRTVIVYDPWYSWNSWGLMNNWNSWNSPWYGNGWMNCGWNSWGMGFGWNNWGWNNWGWGWNNGWNNGWGGWGGWGNNWAYNNGFWNGYNQGYWNGYYDGMWNNPWTGGRNYSMSGPRFQQTSTNNNTGSNTSGKFGKTDETRDIPREGITRPRDNSNAGSGAITPGGRADQPANPAERYSDKRAPNDGWRNAPTNPAPVEDRFRDNPRRENDRFVPAPRDNNVPAERVNPDRFNNRPVERVPAPAEPRRYENVPIERERFSPPAEQPRRFDNTPAPVEQPRRIDRMRDDLNRQMEPTPAPSRPAETPQRFQPREELRNENIQRQQPAPAEREFRQRNAPPQQEMRQPQAPVQRNEPQRMERQMQPREQSQPQRMERQMQPREQSQPQRMERQIPQREMQRFEQPQRQFSQPQQSPQRMERSAPQPSSRPMQMNPGGRRP